ncbi:MAG: hypothetical protein U0V70_12180 [Terriglobia bacterium]
MKNSQLQMFGLIVFLFLILPASIARAGSKTAPRTLIGMQYESFFTPKNEGHWETAEAIPILGKYSSFDVEVIKKHEEWFEFLGIDWLLLDWSNMLWMRPTWEEHQGATKEIEDATALLFKTYSQLARQGKHPPKLVLMLGFQNGPPVPDGTRRLNHIIQWTNENFLANADYKDLWLIYNDKPLLSILYNTPQPCAELAEHSKGVSAADWTVRWMGSQLQDTHVDQCGFWSWMDGTIRQLVTYHNGAAEETVVTPACFPFPSTVHPYPSRKGWLDPQAVGRDHGAPYLESWKTAFETRPAFIQIHQWNEFAGQKEGAGPEHNLYGDEYNVELSEDIEPTQMDQCTLRDCGGWGYYYVNLTKAIISLYRQETPDITVLALSGPVKGAVVKDKMLRLHWNTLGRSPASYDLKVDGRTQVKGIRGESHDLSLAKISPGKHQVTLVANGAYTYFDLAPEKLTRKSAKQLPVSSTIELTYSP